MVEFRSRFDSSKASALNKHSSKRLWIALVLVSLFFIGAGVLSILFLDDFGDFVMGVFFVVMGVLFAPIVLITLKSSQKRVEQSYSLISSDTEEVYTFDEDYITITHNKGEEYTSYTKTKYSYLYRAIEEKDHYFLYISKIQCHVIDKASITQGSLDEMNSLLRVHMGDKFKCKK